MSTPAIAKLQSLRTLGKMLPWPVPSRTASGPPARARQVLIVGAANAGRQLAASMRQQRNGRAVCGLVDEHLPLGGEVLGRVSDLHRLVRSHFVDEIILAPPHDACVVRRVVEEAQRERVSITLVPELYGLALQAVSLGTVGGVPALKLYEHRLPRLGLLAKRAFDILVSAFIFPIAAALTILGAALIKLDSAGPVFFRDLRVGKKGRTFVCYKLRSMAAGADRFQEQLRAGNERQGPFFKIANDPRVTRVGRYLRRYSFDELPQLLNVLMGEMSLVGPRPHPRRDVERYELEHLRRLNVTPGMTGLWQVRARTDPSFERTMQLDLEYIEHWSFWLDLKILLATVPAILRGTGA